MILWPPSSRRSMPCWRSEAAIADVSSANRLATREKDPLVYDLDADLKPLLHFYLGDAVAVSRAAAAVA